MIYLGNGLYSDSGHSLMHAGRRRNLGIDWNNPAQVREYYKEYYAMRNKGDGRIPNYNIPQANRAATIGREVVSSVNNKVRDMGDRQHYMAAKGRVGREIRYNSTTGSKQISWYKPPIPKPSGVSPLATPSKSDKKSSGGGFVTPRPNNTPGRAKADEEKAPRGGFVTPRSSAERRAADDRAHGPRGGFVAPRPDYVIRDQNDKKRGPKGGPHFATKEYQQEQLNKRLHKDSQKAENKAYHDQIARQQGTLYEAAAGGGLMRRRNINGPYESKEAMKEAARRTNASAQAGIEAGRRRAQNKKTEERNLNAGIAAGRERRRNAENAKRGVQSTAAYNRAMKGQEQRGSGTLADYNTQRFSSAKTQKRNADNTNAGITAGRNRATLKKAEDAYNKKLAEEKAKKKANSPYNKTKNAFVKGSEDIVGSAYDAYKKGKKKLKKFFG